MTATKFTGDRTEHNDAFVAEAARTNVRQVLQGIPKRSPVLAELAAKRSIELVGALYNVKTAAVEFLPA